MTGAPTFRHRPLCGAGALQGGRNVPVSEQTTVGYGARALVVVFSVQYTVEFKVSGPSVMVQMRADV